MVTIAFSIPKQGEGQPSRTEGHTDVSVLDAPCRPGNDGVVLITFAASI